MSVEVKKRVKDSDTQTLPFIPDRPKLRTLNQQTMTIVDPLPPTWPKDSEGHPYVFSSDFELDAEFIALPIEHRLELSLASLKGKMSLL